MGSGGFFYSSCLKGEAFPVDFLKLFLENLQILPMGNVRHFRIIHENDIIFSENVRFSLKFSEFVRF